MVVRAFIALEIPKEVRTLIAEIQERLRSAEASVKWVRPANIHLTIKFLGDVETAKLQAIAGKLEKLAKKSRSISLATSTIGVFPNERRPRVIWLGLDGDTESVTKLADVCNSEMLNLGFEKEKRNFKPHLTLGRVKLDKNLDELIDMISKGNLQIMNFNLERMHLIKSDLTPKGAIYENLYSFNINN